MIMPQVVEAEDSEGYQSKRDGAGYADRVGRFDRLSGTFGSRGWQGVRIDGRNPVAG